MSVPAPIPQPSRLRPFLARSTNVLVVRSRLSSPPQRRRQPWPDVWPLGARCRRFTELMIVAGLLLVSTQAAAGLSTSTSAISFSAVVLNGADQLTNGTTSAWRTDATGETGGWHLTVSSSDFDNGAGRMIPVANFTTRLLDTNIVLVSGDPSGPTSTQTSYTPLGATALKIASAASGNGNGVYDLTPQFQLTVPAEAYTGSYTATVTITTLTGP